MHNLQFTFDIGEQAYIRGVPVQNGTDVAAHITVTGINVFSSAIYDTINHQILVIMSTVHIYDAVILKILLLTKQEITLLLQVHNGYLILS
jgi:hypothetical protein